MTEGMQEGQEHLGNRQHKAPYNAATSPAQSEMREQAPIVKDSAAANQQQQGKPGQGRHSQKTDRNGQCTAQLFVDISQRVQTQPEASESGEA